MSRDYFEDLYACNEDPWNFSTSTYEERKYALTVASLPRARYSNAFEPGCSVGVLTEMLALRCERLLATDMMPSPLDRAAFRVRAQRHVRFELRTIPFEWPKDLFDLVVLSELAYYFDVERLTRVMELVIATTVPGAHVLGVHWRGETNYPLTGDVAHTIMGQTRDLRPVVHHVEGDFVLDVWERG
jgi:hypothetical protein